MPRRLIALVAACVVMLTMAAPVAAQPSIGSEATSALSAREPIEVVGRERDLPRRTGRGAAVAVEPPPGTVGVVSAQAFELTDETVLVVGEVKNNTTSRRENIGVVVRFFNGSTMLGQFPVDTVFVFELGFGARSSFFWNGVPPAGASTFDAVVTDPGDVVSAAPAGGLTITPGTSPVEGEIRTYNGTVRNPNPFAVTDIFVAVTTYDGDGDVTDTNWTDAIALPANSQTTFAVDVFDDPNTTRASFVADGFRSSDAAYVTSWNNYFNDVGNNTFRQDIEWLAAAGITTGCAAARYCPNNDVRRDEMASFLSRSLGLTGTPPNRFVDDNGNTHELQINRIAAAGVTNGCSPAANLYCPENNVRRDEMASFLARALDLTGIPPNAFVDDNGNTHELQINRIAAAGVTNGCNPAAQLYCPTGNVTRGQMAAFLRRAFE